MILIDRGEPGSGASYGNGGVLAACSIVPVTVPGLLRKAPRMLLDPDQPLFLKWSYLPRLAPWLRNYLGNCRPERVRQIARALHALTANQMTERPVMFAAAKFVATPMEGRVRLTGIVEFGGLEAPPSHARFLQHQRAGAIAAIDGLSAIVLGVVVIGLMSAVGPAIRSDPLGLLLNLTMAFLTNFGLQILVALGLHARGRHATAVPLAIVAGNRNMALFLTALPLSVMDPLLLFIGCYQIPMYMTPFLLGRLYRRIGEAGRQAG